MVMARCGPDGQSQMGGADQDQPTRLPSHAYGIAGPGWPNWQMEACSSSNPVKYHLCSSMAMALPQGGLACGLYG